MLLGLISACYPILELIDFTRKADLKESEKATFYVRIDVVVNQEWDIGFWVP